EIDVPPPSRYGAMPAADAEGQQQRRQNARQLHQALRPGLLSHLGMLTENREYLGARNRKFVIHAGSGMAKKPPKWVMAFELVETTRLFARTVARTEPQRLAPGA